MGSPDKESCRVGNEGQHQVTLTRKFEIQTTEVTQGRFSSVMGYSPSNFSSCGGICPVERVSWHEAAAYTNALSAKAKLKACYTCSGSGAGVTCSEAAAFSGKDIYTCPGYRLPTEAEWEYAYRAGTSTAFYNWGITSCAGKDPSLDKIGWYLENSDVIYSGCYRSGSRCLGTHRMGQKTSNAWGLYDMAGNVWEWCHDRYDNYPSSGVTDPVGTSGSDRMLRGGCWVFAARYARAANAWGLYDMAGNAREWCHDGYQHNLGSSAVMNPVGSGSKRVSRGGEWGGTPGSMRAARRREVAPADRNYFIGFRCARSK